ncbi:MAG: endonuclease V [Thermodesulfobacteria bacterium]|nr:endonuclease V [Thermodesulfobacteriota bacterium]
MFKNLIRAQKLVASRIKLQDLSKEPRFIAGVDVAYTDEDLGIGAGVVLLFPELKKVEEVVVKKKVKFPYVPGFLSFREAPLMISVVRNFKTKVDVIFVDGQGIAHPRKAGIATHIGVILKIPTIGCAKKPLLKDFLFPSEERGSAEYMFLNGEKVGWVLRTRKGVKPIFVSPGNLISLKDALRLTLAVTKKYRLPEPVRLAHQLSVRAKKGY